VIIIGITQILLALSGIIFLPLITKTIGVHDYGIWVQVNTITSLMLGFIGLGLPYAMTRFLPAQTDKHQIQEELWSVFTLVSLVTLVSSIILIASAGFIAQAFFDGATDIVRISGLIVLVSSLNGVFMGIFRCFRQMKTSAVFSIANTYGQIGVISYLVVNGYGIFSMTLALLAVNAIILLILFFLIRHQIGISKPHFTRIKAYLKFGVPTIAANVAAWVVYSSDRFVIAHFLGATSVGIYSAAYALGSFPILILGILGFILPPTLSKLYDEGRMHELKTHLSYSMKYALTVAIPFVFGAAILAKPILTLFATPEIASQGQIVLILESVSSFILVSGGVICHILLLVKKTKIIGTTWIVAAAVNLGLNLLMVSRIGILGAAIGSLIAYLLAAAILIYYSFKEIKFSIDWLFILKCLLASAIMSVVIWMMHPVGASATILAVIAGIAIYGIVLVLLRGFTKEEFEFFRGMLKRDTAAPNSDNE
jgi:O-antigen/teichoic acid export membrane protein